MLKEIGISNYFIIRKSENIGKSGNKFENALYPFFWILFKIKCRSIFKPLRINWKNILTLISFDLLKIEIAKFHFLVILTWLTVRLSWKWWMKGVVYGLNCSFLCTQKKQEIFLKCFAFLMEFTDWPVNVDMKEHSNSVCMPESNSKLLIPPSKGI